jgi:hypothetical protein
MSLEQSGGQSLPRQQAREISHFFINLSAAVGIHRTVENKIGVNLVSGSQLALTANSAVVARSRSLGFAQRLLCYFLDFGCDCSVVCLDLCLPA